MFFFFCRQGLCLTSHINVTDLNVTFQPVHTRPPDLRWPCTAERFALNICYCRWWRRTTCITLRASVLRASWRRRRNRKRSTSARPMTLVPVFCGTVTTNVLSDGAPSRRWRNWRRRFVWEDGFTLDMIKVLQPTVFQKLYRHSSANNLLMLPKWWSGNLPFLQISLKSVVKATTSPPQHCRKYHVCWQITYSCVLKWIRCDYAFLDYIRIPFCFPHWWDSLSLVFL